jgi:hypothetical protein
MEDGVRLTGAKGLRVTGAGLALGGLTAAAVVWSLHRSGHGTPVGASSPTAVRPTRVASERTPATSSESSSAASSPAPTTPTASPSNSLVVSAPSTPSSRPTSRPTDTVRRSPAVATAPKTTAPASLTQCGTEPNSANTGVPAGTALTNNGSTEIGDSGVTLAGQRFTTQTLQVYGDNVTIKNSSFAGAVVLYGSHDTLSHVTATGIAVSGARSAVVQYANISGGDDGIDVTSDTGPASAVLLDHNYVHDPVVNAQDHEDGTQVRGVDGLTISCSNYDLGAWKPEYNSAIFLEDANGGNSNVRISHNWLNGGGFTLAIQRVANLTVDGNALGTDAHWGSCDSTSLAGSFVFTANTVDGTPTALCTA